MQQYIIFVLALFLYIPIYQYLYKENIHPLFDAILISIISIIAAGAIIAAFIVIKFVLSTTPGKIIVAYICICITLALIYRHNLKAKN